MVSVSPGPGKPTITTGVTVPFSDEYRVRQANLRLLEQLAQQQPRGGTTGQMMPALETSNLDDAVAVDTFRPGVAPARSLQDVWPIAVLIGSTLFFADVFVRRVAVDLGSPLRWIASRFRRTKTSEADKKRQQSIDRLRSSKSQVSGELERQRSAVAIEIPEPNATTAKSSESFGKESLRPAGPILPTPGTPGLKSEEEPSYTSRLLEAKRQAKKKNP
jgi:hypothetical protein